MGNFTYQSRIPQMTAQMRRQGEALVKRTVLAIEADIKTGMAEAKHGREYRRGSGTHTASAPGESPAIDTGMLANSIQTNVQGLQGVVGTNSEYALHLEFGTVHMEPRPFFGPAFERIQKPFQEGLKDLVK